MMPTPRLLVVSDEQRTRADVSEACGRKGYVVDAAPNAVRACELIDERSYDVAVLDEDCGDEQGTELFQVLSDAQQHVKGILCARDPNLDTVERALDSGMRHVAAKPLDTAEVVALVEGLSLEVTRPFDERFPHASNGFQTDDGIILVSRAMCCEWCGRLTRWADPCLGCYFCCHDCYANFRRSQEI